MTLTFSIESWDSYFAECQTLWREHYDELAARPDQMKMKPDVMAYRELYATGALSILVARDRGKMVGYFLTSVRRHLHYADVLCGFEDAYFLSKPYRRGMAGVRLLQAWENAMRARGVQLLFVMTKPFLDMTLLLERLGFKTSDLVLAKWIGD